MDWLALREPYRTLINTRALYPTTLDRNLESNQSLLVLTQHLSLSYTNQLLFSMTDPLPFISSVPSLDTEGRAAVLDYLFEPSTALHTLSIRLLHDQTFSSYYELIASVGLQLMSLVDSSSTSDKQWLHEIFEAHPRLGEKNVNSVQSKSEQIHLHEGENSEVDELRKLNNEYERKFDGKAPFTCPN